MRQAFALIILLALLIPLAGPTAAQELSSLRDQFVAPNPKSYDYDRLAKVSDAVFYVDVKKIEGGRNGKMIAGGPGSVVDFVCVVKEALKGDVETGDIIVRAVGQKFYASGRMLVGPAIFFVRTPRGDSGNRLVYEIADMYGKFFLKPKDPGEIEEMLTAVEKAVARTGGAPAVDSLRRARSDAPMLDSGFNRDDSSRSALSDAPSLDSGTGGDGAEVPAEPAATVEPAAESDLAIDELAPAPGKMVAPYEGTTTGRPGKPAPTGK